MSAASPVRSDTKTSATFETRDCLFCLRAPDRGKRADDVGRILSDGVILPRLHGAGIILNPGHIIISKGGVRDPRYAPD